METKNESVASSVAVIVFGIAAIVVKMLAIAYAFNNVIAPHFGLDSVTSGFVFVLLLTIEIAKYSGTEKKLSNAETIKASLTIAICSLMLFLAAYIVS